LSLRLAQADKLKIDCGTRPLIEVLTHGVVGALRVELWSWS